MNPRTSGRRSFRLQDGPFPVPCQRCWMKPFALLAVFFLFSPVAVASSQGLWPLADWPKQQKEVEATAPKTGDSEPLLSAIDDIANQLNENLQNLGPGQAMLDDGLVICSFVELKKLARTSSFGRYLAEGLINAFQQRQYRVVEVRKTTDILVQPGRGEYGLSRNPGRIKGQAVAGAVLTGTYTLGDDKVLVNARILDNRDATVLSSASVILPVTPLIKHLLADKVTAKSGADRTIVYVKKLEQ